MYELSPRLRHHGAVALLLCLVAMPALAQDVQTEDGEPDSTRPANNRAPVQLEEIVVTAQKKVQNLQDVPVSVGVVDTQAMRDAGSFDAGDLENRVANVEIDIDPQAPVIGIRGFATETDNVGFDPSVGLSVDYVALGRPEFVADGLFDLERIEVLRGSQGTLFGKNTIAGVINFLSAEPSPYFSGDVLASIGDPDQKRIEAGVSVPLGDWLSARLSGLYWDRDGEVDNTTLNRTEGDLEQRAGRLKLMATPGSAWTLGLSTQYSDTRVDYPPWQLFDAAPAALAYSREYDPQTEDDPLDTQTAMNVPGYVERTSDLSRALIEYDHGAVLGLQGLTSTAVIGHAAFDLATIIDIDVSPADLIITDFRNDFSQDSIELRAAGDAGSLFGLGGHVEFVTGVYGYRSDLESHLDTIAGDNLIGFALSTAGFDALGLGDIPGTGLITGLLDALQPLPDIPINDQLLRGFEQDSESYAVFGQMTWHLGERLATIVGLRYGVEDKDADFDVQTVGPGLVGLVVGADTFTTSLNRHETDFSPKLGLQYEWSDDFMSFLTWTRGFKGGGFNATAESADNLEFEPERASSFEAGIKSRWFDRALTFNLTAYRTEVEDLQVVDFVNVSYEVNNAAEAILQGVEIEANWRPSIAWFSLASSMAYGKAEYDSYPNAPAAEDGNDSCGIPDEDGRQDLSGCTLPNAPEFTAALSPLFTLPIGETYALRWGVDLSYRGEQYSASDLDAHSRQGGYTLIGSRLVFGPSDERWAIIVAGTNLSDKRAKDLVFDNSVYADTYVSQQIPLRSLVASFRASW